jgi:hypothetical protein
MYQLTTSYVLPFWCKTAQLMTGKATVGLCMQRLSREGNRWFMHAAFEQGKATVGLCMQSLSREGNHWFMHAEFEQGKATNNSTYTLVPYCTTPATY